VNSLESKRKDGGGVKSDEEAKKGEVKGWGKNVGSGQNFQIPPF
jgi:hypothetical protein